jgi:hypothetical protein
MISFEPFLARMPTALGIAVQIVQNGNEPVEKNSLGIPFESREVF